jgi:hypothetical protein
MEREFESESEKAKALFDESTPSREKEKEKHCLYRGLSFLASAMDQNELTLVSMATKLDSIIRRLDSLEGKTR